jgi:hypothetical protein
VCGWQLLVVRISRVQGSRGPSRRLARRGTRGGRRRNRGIGKQIGATRVRRFPKRVIDGFAIGESKGSQKVQTTTGVSGPFSPSYPSPDAWEAGLGQRVYGPDCRSQGMQFDSSECAELKPTQSCPRVTRARVSYLARDRRFSTPRCQRSVRVSGKALPAHEARRVGRRVREDACIETNCPKRMAVNNPITLPGSNHANGWTERNGDIPTER